MRISDKKEIKKFFPLTAKKLDTSKKLNIFLEAGRWYQENSWKLAKAIEYLLKNIKEGKTEIEIDPMQYSTSSMSQTLRVLTGYTQLPMQNLRDALGIKSSGVQFVCNDGEKTETAIVYWKEQQ